MDQGRFILDEKTEDLGKKVKKVESPAQIPNELPCIYKRESDFYGEFFIYPFREEFRNTFAYEYMDVGLTDMIKAFVGGLYAQERNL
jgi:hypothetical protein